MRKAEAVYATTMEELLFLINNWFTLLDKDLKDFNLISVSHCHPTDQHPKYSAVIVYEFKD
ncbi:hypothetical protein DCD77_06285 [Acinetobacter baumannii]|uniref:hypothetical protein n=1 Tax=Acinetobacter baumannii TaxID=470 RepID=UPI000D35936B|nr:hypothetical protein [Acinetobacter baumannii]PUV05877.1 hypothetical protein DCD77_06285 [Acinetobacter baumannii]